MSSGSEIVLIAAAAAEASRMNAIKAFGVIVRVHPTAFNAILQKENAPLVVVSESFFGGKKYLTSHKGLTFYCKTREPIQFPANSEIISSKSISVPYA